MTTQPPEGPLLSPAEAAAAAAAAAPEEEAGPITVQIGVCSVCHALFLISGDRQTSPCHGSDTLAVLATLTIGPDAQVTGEWGWGPLISADEMREKLDLPVEEEGPAPAAEAPAALPQEEIDDYEVLLSGIGGYLADAGLTEDDVAGWFQRMGADPEAATTAVGRLQAVRDLIQQCRTPEGPPLSGGRLRPPEQPA